MIIQYWKPSFDKSTLGVVVSTAQKTNRAMDSRNYGIRGTNKGFTELHFVSAQRRKYAAKGKECH